MAEITPETSTEGETRRQPDETLKPLRVEASVEVPPGSEVQITIHYRPNPEAAPRRQIIDLTGGSESQHQKIQVDLENIPEHFSFTDWVRRKLPTLPLAAATPTIMLAAAIVVYYLIRLIRLTDFPIFFFTDEAVHTMLAADLVRDGFKGLGGEFLPTFFKSGATFNAGFPVYLQVLPVLLGVRSVFITRFISTTITLLAAVGVGLIFAEVHNRQRGWLAVLVLSIIPAWFYHSRTAFETVEAVSFFAIFLLGYIKYRQGSMRWLIISVVAAALAFYSYSPARVVIAVMGVLLLFSDFKYHWQARSSLWQPFLVGLVLLLPYIRFLALHPGENERHLQLLHSYWIETKPFSWKILQFLKAYAQGLNPFYWFFPNETDLVRHIMKGMGHLGWFFLPFFSVGLVVSLQNWRKTGYRMLFFALLAAPTGAAVAEIGITRAMFMVIPAALFSAIGLDVAISWLLKKLRYPGSLELSLLVVFMVINFGFLDYVLTKGPLWFDNYGMNGMQYGGKQVFDRIKEIQKKNPTVPIVISPDWANGTDILARFHMGDPVTVNLASMDAYINNQQKFQEDTIFVMPPDDFNKVISSGKFDSMRVVDVVFYPDGSPGFIFANLKYNQAANQAFEQEVESRKTLDVSRVNINGEMATAAVSRLDMGDSQTLFDNDINSVIRSYEANPLILEITFDEPQVIKNPWLMIGGSATQITMYVLPEGSDTLLAAGISVQDAAVTRKIILHNPSKNAITRMRFEIRTIRDGEPSHVHLWEIGLQ